MITIKPKQNDNLEFCSKDLQQKYLQEILCLLKDKEKQLGNTLFIEYFYVLRALTSESLAFLTFSEELQEETKNELSNLLIDKPYSKKELGNIKNLLEKYILSDPNLNIVKSFYLKDATEIMMKGSLDLIKFFINQTDEKTQNFKNPKEFQDLYYKIVDNPNISKAINKSIENEKQNAKNKKAFKNFFVFFIISLILILLIFCLYTSIFNFVYINQYLKKFHNSKFLKK